MPKYITDKKTLKEFIEAETQGYPKGIKAYILSALGTSESAIIRKHMILLRKTEYYKNTGHKVLGAIYNIRLRRLQNKYSMYIPINVFDKGLKIKHLGPILINGSVVAGKNCTLHMNTAIASSANQTPILGDNVWLGYGACIIGGVKIANYVAIGANALVNKSVEEENIVVAGVPAKKVSENGTKNWHR